MALSWKDIFSKAPVSDIENDIGKGLPVEDPEIDEAIRRIAEAGGPDRSMLEFMDDWHDDPEA